MNMRTRSIILLGGVLLLLATVILLPRIIEAKRLKDLSANKSLAATPVLTSSNNQDQRTSVIVGASVRNDTSRAAARYETSKSGQKG